MKNKTVLVGEKNRAAYCGSSIAAHTLWLVHCGGAAVGIKVPQYKVRPLLKPKKNTFTHGILLFVWRHNLQKLGISGAKVVSGTIVIYVRNYSKKAMEIPGGLDEIKVVHVKSLCNNSKSWH